MHTPCSVLLAGTKRLHTLRINVQIYSINFEKANKFDLLCSLCVS